MEKNEGHTRKLVLAPEDSREPFLSEIEQTASAATFETLCPVVRATHFPPVILPAVAVSLQKVGVLSLSFHLMSSRESPPRDFDED